MSYRVISNTVSHLEVFRCDRINIAKQKDALQGVTLALAQVSKVSGERKSSITCPFGEYDFRCQEII